MIKRILIGLGVLVFILSAVLAVHIYIVTRPKPLDPKTLVLARVDFPEKISRETKNQIMTFLYSQQSVDHVLINEESYSALFSFYPARVNGNALVMAMNRVIGTNGSRYLPTEKEMMEGCPMNQESFAMKAYKGFARIF